MHTIYANDVTQAFVKGLQLIHRMGEKSPSRNGPVLEVHDPVCTVYTQPARRVLLGAVRDANPFFHVMETLWMLAGRNDVEFPKRFNQRFDSYSDDGSVAWGAYGWRWRSFFGYDQLDLIVDELRKTPTSRRCVLAMWNGMETQHHIAAHILGEGDLPVATQGGKDVPCNTHAYFDCRGGRLNMTVCNRSNDAIWGAYGANVVHMSFLLEYMAARIGIKMGEYRQFSNNLHAYTDVYPHARWKLMMEDALKSSAYTKDTTYVPLVDNPATIDDEIEHFVENPHAMMPYENEFIGTVAFPMYLAHAHWYEDRNYEAALREARVIADPSWRAACEQWLRRRQDRAEKPE